MWIESVQQEANELLNKINKLKQFLRSESSLTLSIDMLELMNIQLTVMRAYHLILIDRLKLAEKEDNCIECYTDSSSIFI